MTRARAASWSSSAPTWAQGTGRHSCSSETQPAAVDDDPGAVDAPPEAAYVGGQHRRDRRARAWGAGRRPEHVATALEQVGPAKAASPHRCRTSPSPKPSSSAGAGRQRGDRAGDLVRVEDLVAVALLGQEQLAVVGEVHARAVSRVTSV